MLYAVTVRTKVPNRLSTTKTVRIEAESSDMAGMLGMLECQPKEFETGTIYQRVLNVQVLTR